MNAPPEESSARKAPASSGRLAISNVVGGRYRLERPIGEGASGTVWQASDLRHGPNVALKILHRELLSDRQIRSRFHREASILRRLVGKNLVPLLAFGEEGDTLYMVLELAGGSSLEALVARESPLDVGRSVRILLEVCDALSCAHGSGVIHRDLKPANIMVEPLEGGGERARVLDFGMAKVVHGEGGTTQLTEANMVFGTPEYMSPEQARGDELDARCDIYAAGVILYELLTGSVPFSGPSAVATMTAHLTEPLVPPSVRAPQRAIAPALEAVVVHALSRDRKTRYPSAVALRDALARAASDPADVDSVRPPPVTDEDLAMSDTDSALSAPPRAAGTSQAALEAPPGRSQWIVAALVAGAVGIGLGVWLSLRS